MSRDKKLVILVAIIIGVLLIVYAAINKGLTFRTQIRQQPTAAVAPLPIQPSAKGLTKLGPLAQEDGEPPAESDDTCEPEKVAEEMEAILTEEAEQAVALAEPELIRLLKSAFRQKAEEILASTDPIKKFQTDDFELFRTLEGNVSILGKEHQATCVRPEDFFQGEFFADFSKTINIGTIRRRGFTLSGKILPQQRYSLVAKTDGWHEGDGWHLERNKKGFTVGNGKVEITVQKGMRAPVSGDKLFGIKVESRFRR